MCVIAQVMKASSRDSAIEAPPPSDEGRFVTVRKTHLVPGPDDEPLTPKEVRVAGINHRGLCGIHRQAVIAGCRVGEELLVLRFPENPHDSNAIGLFRKDGQDIGMLPAEIAVEMAPRLDKGSPITATITGLEPFLSTGGNELIGVRVTLVPHRIKRRRRPGDARTMSLVDRSTVSLGRKAF